MPRVPTAAAEYRPYSTAQPTTEGPRPLHIQAPFEEAFGVNIGRAMAGLGGEVSKTGQELFQRANALQELQNESDAREKASQAIDAGATPQEQYLATEGKDARDTLQSHLGNMRGIEDQYRGQLTNESAKRHYDTYMFAHSRSNVKTSIGHAARQDRAYHDQTVEAIADNAAADLYRSPDADKLDAYYAKIEEDAKTKAGLKGVPDDDPIIEKWKHDKKLKGISNYLKGMADIKPIKALDDFEKSIDAGVIEGDEAARVQAYIWNRYAGAIGRNKEKEINGDLYDKDVATHKPEKTLGERTNEALKWIDEQNYPEGLKEMVTEKLLNNVRAGYGKYEKDVVDINKRNFDVVKNALNGYDQNGQPGALPISEDEIRAKGTKVSLALDALREQSPSLYASLMRAAEHNARKDVAPTKEGDMMYRGLHGLADEHPDQFVAVNLWDEKYDKLTRSQRDKLFDLQDKKKLAPEKDPNVSRAVRIMKDAGIWPQNLTEATDPTAYHWLTGSLQLEIKAMTGEALKPPSDEEIRTLGKALTAEVPGTASWLTFGLGKNDPYYQNLWQNIQKEGVPEGAADIIRRDHPDWNDDKIQEQYIANLIKMQYKKQLETKTPKGPIKVVR
jgi:hypothetical protein